MAVLGQKPLGHAPIAHPDNGELHTGGLYSVPVHLTLELRNVHAHNGVLIPGNAVLAGGEALPVVFKLRYVKVGNYQFPGVDVLYKPHTLRYYAGRPCGASGLLLLGLPGKKNDDNGDYHHRQRYRRTYK